MNGTRQSRPTLFALLVALTCAQLACSPSLGQDTHVGANVPAKTDFDRMLRRDLEAYFAGISATPLTALDYQLLRDGPTQSGLAYPKFYAWVVVQLGADDVREGAVRLAAIERERFEVTDFLSRDAIAANPAILQSVFPEPVCVRIEEMLRP